jgi:hypothetical protein
MVRRVLSTVAALIAVVLAARAAWAVDVGGVGGMGLNIWPMAIALDGTARTHLGFGGG